ncbi:Cytochrome p450 [Aspergillus sclerotialis]|uniref:Cytochrome p450 n=1 Tax=Aspergillus sclerotialis TaxID=2070753 RepID=A0A3A2ZXT1_9EURO|nr:Cytochrome p450 [Aspergillus sclerotialis]
MPPVDIYGPGSKVRKSKVYDTLVHRTPNTLTLRDKKEHAQRRRLMSHGFSDASIRSFEPRVLQLVHRLCDILDGDMPINDGQWGNPQDMAKWFDYLTFDIMSSLVFSASYDTLRQEKFRYVIRAIEESNIRVSVLLQAPILSLFRLDKRLFSRSLHWRNRFIKFIGRTVADRIKKSSVLNEGDKGRDVFSYFQSGKDAVTGKTFGINELGGEAATLIVAGSDTTATTLAATLFFISQEPSAYRRVVQEVRSCFGSPDEIRNGSQLNSCRFLRACIDEALRLSPPAGSALWREVEEGGALIDGCHIPAGYDVAVGVFSVHHNPTYYPNPFRFDPDRWLTDGSRETRAAFMPFSIGTRSCIGKGLAQAEILVTLANIIWRFEFKAADGMEHPREYILQDHVTGAKKGPVLQFRRVHRT